MVRRRFALEGNRDMGNGDMREFLDERTNGMGDPYRRERYPRVGKSRWDLRDRHWLYDIDLFFASFL